MGNTGKHWIINFFTGKKDHKEKEISENRVIGNLLITSASYGNEHQYQCPTTRPLSIPRATAPKEKRRWSFCRSPAAPASVFVERIMDTSTTTASVMVRRCMEINDSRKQAMAAAANGRASAVEDGAAIKLQSVFRAHLARRALKALKGLVRLQALVRGILVRKQVNITLRCMASLVTAQRRARAQRLIHVAHEDAESIVQSSFSKSTHKYKFKNLNDHNSSCSKHVVEMNIIKTENKTSKPPSSVITSDHTSPRTCSNHFERYSFDPARTPFAYPRSEYGESFYEDYDNHLYLYPNYMANTESSRAKLRAHSVPKQRPVETLGMRTSRRRFSLESNNATIIDDREKRRVRVN